MLNLASVRTLTRHGYDMPAILAAMNAEIGRAHV